VPGEDRRARTRLVFLDAVDPHPPAGAFPTTPTPEWVLEPRIRELPLEGPARARTIGMRLPVAVPPRQVPKLIAAGIALSPYQRDDAYASTEPRWRVLWFEFAEPVADPNDALFARVTAYGPDPLLSGVLTHAGTGARRADRAHEMVRPHRVVVADAAGTAAAGR
jgi:hypothetical protein